jgi:F1F0 ATPase subunit 2
MSEPGLWLQLLASGAAGALLGWAYFAGLRRTVDRLPASRAPGTLVLLSFTLRMTAALAVLALVAHLAHAHGLVAALLAFVAVRAAMIRRTGTDKAPSGAARGSR